MCIATFVEAQGGQSGVLPTSLYLSPLRWDLLLTLAASNILQSLLQQWVKSNVLMWVPGI